MTTEMTVEDIQALVGDFLDTDKANAERVQREKRIADLKAQSDAWELKNKKSLDAYAQRNLQKIAQGDRNKKSTSSKLTGSLGFKQNKK